MKIQPLKELVKEALIDVKKYQTGEKKILKCGRPYIDDVGIGLVNGSVCLVAAGSGVGKSYELARIQKNILNKDINPNADNIVSLNVSLEMRILSLVLRDLEGKLSKDKKNILLSEFSDEEKALVKEYYELLQDDRQFVCQSPTSVSDFKEGCITFLEEHKNKESCIVSVDHIVLISSDKGQNKNQVVESLVETINVLKMTYPNVIFILLSQTNSENQKRIKDKDRMAQPKDLDIYYSQFSFQVADYVVVITNPWKLGISSYSKLNPSRYPDLEDFFIDEDSKGRVSLDTEGVLYYHLLKCREGGAHYTDIFAERLNLPDGYKKEKDIEPKQTISTDMPVFPQPEIQEPIEPISPFEAFGPPVEDENSDTPF